MDAHQVRPVQVVMNETSMKLYFSPGGSRHILLFDPSMSIERQAISGLITPSRIARRLVTALRAAG
jgi:hypothetical protein